MNIQCTGAGKDIDFLKQNQRGNSGCTESLTSDVSCVMNWSYMGLTSQSRRISLESRLEEEQTLIISGKSREIQSSSEEAIKILIAARDAIKSSTEVMKELGLTPRVYYTLLNDLQKAGLIEATEGSYQLTQLGKFCYDMGHAFKKLARS